MFKRILFTVFILITIATLSLSAAQEKGSVSALFFQYSYDNDLNEIDSIGAYVRAFQFYDGQVGSSFGTTLEIPIGYSNDRTAFKMSGFGGPSFRFSINEDYLLTIGPSIAATLLSDSNYKMIMVDIGVIVDMANSYPLSDRVDAIIGGSLIYDIARYSIIKTSSINSSDFEQDFSQISGKIYLGFSVSK